MCGCLIVTVRVEFVTSSHFLYIRFCSNSRRTLIRMTFVQHILVVKGHMVLVRLLISTPYYTVRLRNVSRLRRGMYCCRHHKDQHTECAEPRCTRTRSSLSQDRQSGQSMESPALSQLSGEYSGIY